MKKLFYSGLLLLVVFEILNIYFIMPIPGSQQMESIGWAYFLYSWRWVFRIIFIGMILAGLTSAFRVKWKIFPALTILAAGSVIYLANNKMSADKMFLQVRSLEFKDKINNKLPGDRLVIAIEKNGEAKGYPVEFLSYHHQVRDSIGKIPVMVTYCSVCRSGRVFEPVVNGKTEEFRLVGMDHFNAMFEDASTGSWWRQVNGEAVAGKLKGTRLPEFPSMQITIDKLFELYPHALVMQADTNFLNIYDPLARFESGKNTGSLTRTDTLSWKEKSWVAGIVVDGRSKAYDWNDLKKKSVINDTIGPIPVVLLLSSDGKSFTAYRRPSGKIITLQNDTLFLEGASYSFTGQNLENPSITLPRINVYQEFWHSWRTFHPGTTQYSKK